MDFVFQSSLVFLHSLKKKWIETLKETKNQYKPDIPYISDISDIPDIVHIPSISGISDIPSISGISAISGIVDIKEEEEEDNGYGFYIDMEDIRDLEEENKDHHQKEKENRTITIKRYIKPCVSGMVSMASVLYVGQMLQVYGRMSPFRIYSFYAFYTIYSALLMRLVWISPKK
jgi:hypothetical protein